MSRYRRFLSFFVLAALILTACQPVMPVQTGAPAETQPTGSEPEISPTTWDEVFVIGMADRSRMEFATKGVDQSQEYTCTIGIDCTVEDIPAGLRRVRSQGYGYHIPQLTIVFQLNRNYNELVLHLARAGSETTSVSVDGGEPLFVTRKMLGSVDGGSYGSYDLPLGPAQSGSHSITFAVPADGGGNGHYSWDALSLSAR